jgi:tripartite-type tricarboxylate transporter receptor subunit TctC
MLIQRRPLLIGSALAAPSLNAFAQPVSSGRRPERSIRAVVPFAPGGLANLTARLVTEQAGSLLGQPINVENRTGGAGGLIGSDLVAKAAPDGYTILISAHAIAPALVARMPYDVATDFMRLAVLAAAPMVLVCHPGVPARNLGELLLLLRPDCPAGIVGIRSKPHRCPIACSNWLRFSRNQDSI